MYATISKHLEEAAAGVIILGVFLQVPGESLNPFRQERNLHSRRASVRVVYL